MSFVVAIDGPAAAGKGTISRAVALEFGFSYLDTGLLYRAVGYSVLQRGLNPDKLQEIREIAQQLQLKDLKEENLRTSEVARIASIIATIPDIRAALLSFQHEFVQNNDKSVLDGRDIGSVICPDAQVKLFITASSEERAKRRFLELKETQPQITYDQVHADVLTRDKCDSERVESPLSIANDAVVIDTTDVTIDQAIQAAIEVVSEAFSQHLYLS